MQTDDADLPTSRVRQDPAEAAKLLRSLTENRNPYEGRTIYTERPDPLHAEDRGTDPKELRVAQQQWDAAEALRKSLSDASVHTLMSTNETREEPASKALENRLRIRFLSTKGATMQGWIEARDRIIAEALASGQN